MEQNKVPCYPNVMIIDDNKIDLYVVEIILKKNNFATEVVKMETAKDALNYLTANCEHPEKLPSLIFLDINMPGMNGFEFMDEYQLLPDTIKKDCIIMMLTTSIHPDDMERATHNKYILRFINKPLNADKLWEMFQYINAQQN